MRKIVWFGLAGAVGSLSRAGLTRLLQARFSSEFPLGTLTVNALGCFMFGVIWAFGEEGSVLGAELRLAVVVGFLGAFTTFSTFSFEAAMLLRCAQWWWAADCILLSNIAGVVLALAGMALVRVFYEQRSASRAAGSALLRGRRDVEAGPRKRMTPSSLATKALHAVAEPGKRNRPVEVTPRPSPGALGSVAVGLEGLPMQQRSRNPLVRHALAAALLGALLWAPCFLAASWAEATSAAAPAAGVAPSLEAQRQVLPNGLVVLVAQKRKLPILRAQLLLRVGAAHEPETQAGLVNLLADLLDKGAGKRSAAEIAETIEFLGGSLSVDASAFTLEVELEVLSKDSATGFELFRDVVRQATFAPAEVERARAAILSELARRDENPNQVAADAFREILYGEHPLHRPVEGYEKTVARLTRQDVVAFYERFARPEHGILVIVSDLPPERMLALAQAAFASWERGAATVPAVPAAVAPRGLRVRLVDRELNQSYVQLGHLGVPRASPDYNAVRAMNYILGGSGFSSRLYETVREQHGLAYSVHSYFQPQGRGPGSFEVGLQTKIASTSQALDEVFRELERMRQAPVSADELKATQEYYRGSLPRLTERYGQVAELLLTQEYHGLPAEFWRHDINAIERLTAADLQRVARQYLHPRDLVVSIATKRAELKLTTPALQGAEMLHGDGAAR